MTIENKPLLAFHGDMKIKKKYLARVRAHRKADEIVSGKYWENGKGCAVGCTIHGSSHKAYEDEIGHPQILARLEDRLFEAIYKFNPKLAKAWPEAIPSRPPNPAPIWPWFGARGVRSLALERTKRPEFSASPSVNPPRGPS